MRLQLLMALQIIMLPVGLLQVGLSAPPHELDLFFKPTALRALILSGRNNHDWRATTSYLKQILLASGRFDVRVTGEAAGLTSATLSAYDVLVLNYAGPRWDEVTENAVEEFVKSGKGLVVVRAASYAFTGLEVVDERHKPTGIRQAPWEEYLKMIGGYWAENSPKTGHTELYSFLVKITDRQHAIARGMKESFIATDEMYYRMRMRPEAHILGEPLSDPTYGGSGREEPILWTVRYGRGRVFHTTLGHEPASMGESGFIATFLRGAEWAAGETVTLPPEISAQPSSGGRLRVLVVTGGHDYPTTFYALFEGENWHWQHAASNRDAFRADIRSNFDVLVLYDSSQEISEAERKNLVDFLEAGKGMVVLHHAIVNYSSWDWWAQDVVGGKYLMKPEGERPASTYLHDQELFVEAVANHPILAGIGRIHIWDETYKGLWISPKVTVLLKTDHPSSDGPIAWISPYKKSRVVYIQLGHDEKAHLHPAFRLLVRNAIRWAGGRLVEKNK